MDSPSTRTLVIIDAVEWSSDYPSPHPLRDVGRWFLRFLESGHGLRFEVLAASSGDVASVTAKQDLAGVIVSGSPRDAWVPDPVNDQLAKLVLDCHEKKVPCLGVCYGHQLMAVALGGSVGRDPAGVEMGNTLIELTEAGQRDPLFDGLPASFEAMESHQDCVLTLPQGAELLATGKHTRVQAFRFGPYLRGVQFHPEHDPDIVRFVWEPRRTTWRERCHFDIGARMEELKPTPDAPQILLNFAKICQPSLS